MPAEISADFSGVIRNLLLVSPKVEARVLEALDEAAENVSNSAKLGHPVLPDGLKDSFDPSVTDPYRELNGVEPYGGTYRFLSRTGVTRNSIVPVRAANNSGVLSSQVVSGVAQSNDLEFGTPDRRAFPFMRPALEQWRPWIQNRVEQAVSAGLED